VLWAVPLLLTQAAACHGTGSQAPQGVLTATLAGTQFNVADHMAASIEMQLSGEPFAVLLGYNLSGFSRTLTTTDQYNPCAGIDGGICWETDPLGFALSVETYEYSKQPMNNLSFESGAGLSVLYGPLINPSQETVTTNPNAWTARFQQFAGEANAGGDAGTTIIVSPAPVLNTLNYYGFPGLWAQFAEFSSFDPSIDPLPGQVPHCVMGGDGNATASVGSFAYGGGLPPSGLLVSDYECDYNSLNLPDRDAQVTKTLVPEALGYTLWKQGMWTINFWGTLQDANFDGITYVDAGCDCLSEVGQPGNQVVGEYPDPSDPTGLTMLPGVPGVFLGDIPVEGWQGLTMQEEAQNKAVFILNSLLTSDGVTLTGAPSTLAADQYSYDSPLLWFPSVVSVVETPTTEYAIEQDLYFPKPTSLTITDGSSQLRGLSGLLGGFSEAFAWTDQNNANVGGSIPFLVTYDGDPFPADDGLPDGQATMHDWSLGILKIALVDLDRLHFDPVNQVLVDSATVAKGNVTRGTTVTTIELAKSIVAMRNAFRGLNGSLQLYSNDTCDTQGVPAALDIAELSGASYDGTLESHIISLITAEANFLSAKLISSTGAVANGYDLAAQAPDPSPTNLESEMGAIRALLDAYLATSDETYRTLATLVYADLQNRFWMSGPRVFRTTAGVDNLMQYTPIRFGMLTGALRQYYKLVASNPLQQQTVGVQLLAELLRSYKLILNGWDDRNQDNVIQYPEECLSSGMEMAERMLTGELGLPQDHGDRDSDCVKELSMRGLPAALAAELDINVPSLSAL
jgi:hypothetical protein